MNLIEKIDNDLKQAMKEKNELLILVLRTINSEIHNKEIEKKSASSTDKVEITDEDVLGVLMSETKKRKEAIEEFSAHLTSFVGGSAHEQSEMSGKKEKIENLIKKEEKELEILKRYLPEQMSEEQIREEAKKTIEETNATGAQDTGKVMSVLMPKLKGRAEGGVVSKIVNDLLRS